MSTEQRLGLLPRLYSIVLANNRTNPRIVAQRFSPHALTAAIVIPWQVSVTSHAEKVLNDDEVTVNHITLVSAAYMGLLTYFLL